MPLIHFADHAQGRFELVAAVAAQRADHVAGQAFRVDAHRHIFGVGHVAADDGDVFLVVLVIVKSDDVELPKTGGQFGNRRNLDADMVRADAVTGVGAAFVEQFFDVHLGESHLSSP